MPEPLIRHRGCVAGGTLVISAARADFLWESMGGAAEKGGAMQSTELYPQTTTQLKTGDTLLFYTDGITEARSADGEFFGEERLDYLLAKSRASVDAAELLAAITAALAPFSPRPRPSDDQTLLVAIVR